MEFLRCKISTGEILELPWDGDSTYFCPICGRNHGNNPAYGIDGWASFQSCFSCHFEFGTSEAQSTYGAVRPLADRIKVERLKWLDRMGWRDSAVNQVCDVFGLTIEILKRDRDRFSLSGKGPEQITEPLESPQNHGNQLSVSKAIRTTITSSSSTKRFDETCRLPDGALTQLLTNAALSESGFNLEHCRFVLINDSDLRLRISNHVRECKFGDVRSVVTGASSLILLTADLLAWKKSALRDFDELLDGLLAKFTRPMVDEIDEFYAHDEQLQRDEAQRSLGAATQTLLLTATSLGLQSFPIINYDHRVVSELINLPEGFCVGPMIAIGVPHEFSREKNKVISPDEYTVTDRFPD